MGRTNLKVKIGHINIRSLIPSFADFSHIVVQNNFDIFTVTETWLSNDVPSEAVHIPGYYLFRHDRTTGRGGGVAVYIKNILTSQEVTLDMVDDNIIEHMWVNIKLNTQSLVLGVVYRPPHNNVAECINVFDNILSYLVPMHDNIVVTGDVNINLFNLNNVLSQCFSAYGFSQIINEPTRITNHSQTLIDPIFVNNGDIINNSGTINADTLTDHRLVFCEINIKISKPMQKVHIYREFKSLNIDLFSDDLQSVPWQNIFYINNIDDKVDFLTKKIISLFDLHAPVRYARMNKPYAPWITDNIKLIMKQRDKALTKYKQNSTVDNWNSYKELRNYTTAAIRREKVAFIQYSENQGSKKFWKSLKNLNIITKKNNKHLPNELNDPNLINNYFVSVYNNKGVPRNILAFYKNNKYNNALNFSFQPVDSEEVTKIINGFKSNSSGIDEISLQMIQLCCPSIIPYITHLINCCLTEGYFPSVWKEATICPIPKINCPADVKDLRPISLLSIFSKILEKVVYIQIEKYLLKNKLFPEHQAGFRAGYSTSTVLTNISDDVLRDLDSKLVAILVFLDYSRPLTQLIILYYAQSYTFMVLTIYVLSFLIAS